MSFFYISFASEEKGFLGVALVRASDAKSAILKTQSLGINPGGPAAIIKVSDDDQETPTGRCPDHFLDHLLGKPELEIIFGDIVRHGDMPKEDRDNLEAYVERVCEACNPFKIQGRL